MFGRVVLQLWPDKGLKLWIFRALVPYPAQALTFLNSSSFSYLRCIRRTCFSMSSQALQRRPHPGQVHWKTMRVPLWNCNKDELSECDSGWIRLLNSGANFEALIRKHLKLADAESILITFWSPESGIDFPSRRQLRGQCNLNNDFSCPSREA